MVEDFDAQIKALQQKKRDANKVEAKRNLISVIGNKSSTVEQMLEACYSFIGTHRLNTGAPKAKQTVPAPTSS